MRRFAFPFVLLAAALMSACGGGGPVADGANNTVALPAAANAVAEPSPSGPDGSPPENATSAWTPDRSAPAARIPAFLQGRWGLTPADCTSTRGDAKGLLTVTPTALRFYESRAVPTGNIGGTDNSFTADFAFTGEGQSWTGFETLQLQDKRLVRTTSNPMASYTYAKCS